MVLLPISIQQVRNEIEAAVSPLPPGWMVMVDEATDNIIVTDNNIGFCITRKAIDDNIWPNKVGPLLAMAVGLSVRDGERRMTEFGPISTLHDLQNPPSPFDQ